MAIITLTTDFGEQDYYVAAFKGEILSACPAVQIVDLSNNIPPYDIRHASYVLKNAFTHFPKRSIHVARAFEWSEKTTRVIACTYKDHFFIAPDNGLLSMVFEDQPSVVVHVDPGRLVMRTPHDLYTKAIRTIVYDGSLADLGMPINDMDNRHMLRPIIQEDSIRGIIMHIDYYGNAITNIRKDEFESTIKDKGFNLWLRRNDRIQKIAENYADVPQGEQLARFNSKGQLEISVHCGRADELLGLREGDNIKIDY